MIDNYLFDVIFVGVVFLSSIFGYFSGMLREFLLLVYLVISLLLAVLISGFLSPIFYKILDSYQVASAVTIVFTWMIMFSILFIIGKLFLNRFVKKVGVVNNFLGMIYGAFRGYILMCLFLLLYSILLQTTDSFPNWISGGKTYSITEKGYTVISNKVIPYISSFATKAIAEDEDSP